MSQIIINEHIKRSLYNEWIVIIDMKKIKTLFQDQCQQFIDSIDCKCLLGIMKL